MKLTRLKQNKNQGKVRQVINEQMTVQQKELSAAVEQDEQEELPL